MGLITPLILTTIMIAQQLSPSQQAQLLESAQAAYNSGVDARGEVAQRAFAESALQFRELVEAGNSTAGMHYNLANALLRSGRVGEAILHYRIADERAPGDERIGANLAYARSLRRDDIRDSGGRELLDVLLAWHHRTGTTFRGVLFLTAWSVAWGMLILIRRRPWAGWWVGLVGATILGIFTGLSLLAEHLGWGARAIGVITADEVMVRKGNGTGFDLKFAEPLHEGVEFELLEQRNDWIEIELPDGSDGWIPVSSAVTTSFE